MAYRRRARDEGETDYTDAWDILDQLTEDPEFRRQYEERYGHHRSEDAKHHWSKQGGRDQEGMGPRGAQRDPLSARQGEGEMNEAIDRLAGKLGDRMRRGAHDSAPRRDPFMERLRFNQSKTPVGTLDQASNPFSIRTSVDAMQTGVPSLEQLNSSPTGC